MIRPIEKAIVVILIVVGMPFLAAFLTKVLFTHLLLAFIVGIFFFILALILIDVVLKESPNTTKGDES